MSDIDSLIADLRKVGAESPEAAREVYETVAYETKKFWRSAASTGRTTSKYARKISYDMSVSGTVVSGEIGATLGGAGSFGMLDDPRNAAGVRSAPSRARLAAAEFTDKNLTRVSNATIGRLLERSAL